MPNIYDDFENNLRMGRMLLLEEGNCRDSKIKFLKAKSANINNHRVRNYLKAWENICLDKNDKDRGLEWSKI